MLSDVFLLKLPSIRRFPSILWKRIAHELDEFLVKRKVEEFYVFCWNYTSFGNVAKQRYVSVCPAIEICEAQEIITEYFSGKWAVDGKPNEHIGHYTSQAKGNRPTPTQKYNRFVPSMYTLKQYTSDKGTSINWINTRKISELAHILVEIYKKDTTSANLLRCHKQLFFNLHFLYAMIKLKRQNELCALILSCLKQTRTITIEAVELWHLNHLLMMNKIFLVMHAETLGAFLVSYFLPYHCLLPSFTDLIEQADNMGLSLCALTPAHHQYELSKELAVIIVPSTSGPIRDALFNEDILYVLSDRLVGFPINNSSQHLMNLNLKFVSQRAALMMTVDNSHAEQTAFIYICTTHDVFIISTSSGQLHRVIHCRDHVGFPEAMITGIKLVGPASMQLLCVWFSTRQVLLYYLPSAVLALTRRLPNEIMHCFDSQSNVCIGFLLQSKSIAWIRYPENREQQTFNKNVRNLFSHTPLPFDGDICDFEHRYVKTCSGDCHHLLILTEMCLLVHILINCGGSVRAVKQSLLSSEAVTKPRKLSACFITDHPVTIIVSVLTDTMLYAAKFIESDQDDFTMWWMCSHVASYDTIVTTESYPLNILAAKENVLHYLTIEEHPSADINMISTQNMYNTPLQMLRIGKGRT